MASVPSSRRSFALHPVKDLRQVWMYLQDHFRQDFSWGYYLGVLAFIGVCIGINYFAFGKITGERWLIRKFNMQETGILAYWLFYSFPYYAILLWQGLFHKQSVPWRKRDFWVRTLFGLFLLSFDAAFYYYRYAADFTTDPSWRFFILKCAGNMISIFAIFLPLLVWYWLVDRRNREGFYGLRLRGFDARPYFWMLLLMVPLIAAASFLPDFLRAYPNFQPERMAMVPGLEPWLGYLIFEPIYLFDYTWTELIFRGFMVMGLTKVLGPHAVMPMVGIYAFRHFAKPLGETIGSIFGGWILGVIALRSKHIMGGVLLHMGVAALMDLFAALQG